MSANAWMIIAIIGFSLSGVALVAAIIMFIKMNIPAIIGDLTGRTVAREIKAIRSTNALSGDKRFRSSPVNIERGMLTEKVNESSVSDMAPAHISKRLDKTQNSEPIDRTKRRSGTVSLSDAVQSESDHTATKATEVLDSSATEVLDDNATEVLEENLTEVLDANATEVLDNNSTEVLNDNGTEALNAKATEVLSNSAQTDSYGTTVLSRVNEQKEEPAKPVEFRIKHVEVVVHSDEVIE